MKGLKENTKVMWAKEENLSLKWSKNRMEFKILIFAISSIELQGVNLCRKTFYADRKYNVCWKIITTIPPENDTVEKEWYGKNRDYERDFTRHKEIKEMQFTLILILRRKFQGQKNQKFSFVIKKSWRKHFPFFSLPVHFCEE